MPIEPISISSAGALEDGNSADSGDVQHFSNQEMSSAALATPTRQLAHRDNLLASKVNELVAAYNNDERFVSLPIPRIALPPATGTVVSNFRIPAGFEARVVSSTVVSSPAGNARLSIQHNADESATVASFGADSGTAIVETAGEFKGGTQYVSAGELIVLAYNDGAISSEIVASVMIVLRSVGTRAGVVITSGATGAKGDKGDKGTKGDTGSAGTTGATGAPGLTWRGTYAGSEDYAVSDVVRSLVDSKYTAFICVSANGAASPHAPSTAGSDTAYWELFVAAGATGATGATGGVGETGATGATGEQGDKGDKGDQGDSGWLYRGEWNESTNYNHGDAVTATLINGTGTLVSTFIAADTSVAQAPHEDTSAWRPMFNAANAPGYTSSTVYGTFFRKTAFSAGAATGWGGTGGNNFYTAPPADADSIPFRESAVRADQTGIAFLTGDYNYNFTGSAVFSLPNTTDGAVVDWDAADVSVDVLTNGSLTLAYWATGDQVGVYGTTSTATPTAVRIRGERVF